MIVAALALTSGLFDIKINNAIFQESSTTLRQSSIGSKVIQNIVEVETATSKQAKIMEN